MPGFYPLRPARESPGRSICFSRDAFDFDPDGFYATLLDLHEQNIIRIDTLSEPTSPFSLSAPDMDEYERKVIGFLRANSHGGVFSAPGFEANVKSLAKSNKSSELARLRTAMDDILRYVDDDMVRHHVIGRGIRALGIRFETWQLIFPFILVAMFIIPFITSPGILKNTVLVTAMVLLLQSSVVAAPPTLFGRWKEDYYKEKLEWDAFRTFLGDFAMIQKYAPQDLGMWKEWLIYGTALGVGDTVELAMNDLNISIPEALAIHTIHTSFGHAYSSSAPASSDSGGFGGGGSGGGFGGGGGGEAEVGEVETLFRFIIQHRIQR